MHGIQYKIQDYKDFRKKKTGENIWVLWLGKKFLGVTPKAWSIKENLIN